MSTTWLPEPVQCPSCGHEIHGFSAAAADAGAPRPGDLSICEFCGTMAQFDASMAIVPLDPGQRASAVAATPEAALVQAAVRALRNPAAN
jgi:hypothetical protein